MTCEAGGTDVTIPAIGRVPAGPLVPRYANVRRQGAAPCRGPHRCASILLVPAWVAIPRGDADTVDAKLKFPFHIRRTLVVLSVG